MTDEIFLDLLQFFEGDEDIARRTADAVERHGHWLIAAVRKDAPPERLMRELELPDGERERLALAYAVGAFARLLPSRGTH